MSRLLARRPGFLLLAAALVAACTPNPGQLPSPAGTSPAFGLAPSGSATPAVGPSAPAGPPFGKPQGTPVPGVPGQVTTIAGGDDEGFQDGPGYLARFNGPTGLAVGPDDALYVADSLNHRIRRIDLADPDFRVTTVAGSGETPTADRPLVDGGFADGPGLSARFFEPAHLAMTPGGTLYVADAFNHRVRMIAFGANGAADVRTVAGGATEGGADGPGDKATFKVPYGLALEGGDLWVTDNFGQTVRKIVDPAGQPVVSTVAGVFEQTDYRDGVGPEARFALPTGIAVDPEGRAYVVDTRGCHLRRVTKDGGVLTLNGVELDACGRVDGVLDGGKMNNPLALTVWPGRDRFTLLVGDEGNRLVRRVELTNDQGDGTIETFAGNEAGFQDGALREAKFTRPRGIAVAGDGTIFVVDANRIRRIAPN